MTTKITHKKADKLLEAHGLGMDTPTAYFKNGEPCQTSTFTAEFGTQDNYDYMAVLYWLGYCCRWC